MIWKIELDSELLAQFTEYATLLDWTIRNKQKTEIAEFCAKVNVSVAQFRLAFYYSIYYLMLILTFEKKK